jgi:hypothetical protein
MSAARAWYESASYQEILPLRTRHIEGDAILVEGVEPGYDPARLSDNLERAAST